MRKKINVNLIIFALLSFFVVSKGVKAQEYIYDLIPYNVSEVCPEFDEDGYYIFDCWDSYIYGDLDDYQITNGMIEPGQKLMLLLNIKPSADSELVFMRLALDFDSKFISLAGSYTNNKNVAGRNGGIFPPKPKSPRETNWRIDDNYVHDTTVQGEYVADRYLMIITDDVSMIPVVESGTMMAIFFEVPEDAPAGQETSITFNLKKASLTAEDTTNLTSYATFNDLTLKTKEADAEPTDGTLKTLTATGNNSIDYLDGKFVASTDTPEAKEYNLIVPYSVDELTFAGEPTYDTSTILSGTTGTQSLNVGDDNHFTISVQDAATKMTNYVVNVTRLSNDTTISNVTATNDITFSGPTSNKYTATVPYKTDKTNITITPNHSSAVVASDSPDKDGEWIIDSSSTADKKNTYTVKIEAEDCKYNTTDVPGNVCTTDNYTFEITRTAPSKDLTLSDLKVDGVQVPGFSTSKDTYTLDPVASDKTSVNIEAILNDSKNTITSGTGDVNLSVGDNALKVVATSEDGVTTKEYTINIYRKSSEDALQSLTVTTNPASTLVPPFPTSSADSYTYSYDASVTSIDISATVKDTDKAKVKIVDTTDGKNDELVASTLNTASTTVTNATTNIEIIVTPEDENLTPRTYSLTLNRSQSTNNFLSSLSISPGTINETFNKTTTLYTATVPADATSTTVSYTKDDNNIQSVVVSGENGTPDGTGFKFGAGNIISIVVTSESGAVNTYTINVTREEYDIATLDDLQVGFGDDTPTTITGFKKDKFDYTLYTKTSPLPYDKTSIKIGYTKTNEYSKVSGSGTDTTNNPATKVVNTGDNTYQVVVTSQDGSNTNTYNIKVYREKNTDNDTKGVVVAGETATLGDTALGQDPNDYYVTLPNNKETLTPSEVVITASPDATVVKQTDTLNLSTSADNVFTYSITNENGDTQNYKIHVIRTKSNDATIKTVYLRLGSESTPSRSCNFIGNNKSCTISVPEDTTSYYLEPELKTGQTLNPDSTTEYTMDPDDAADSSQTRNLKVIAEDGTEDNYTVVVERAKSSNANLSGLTITDITDGASNAIDTTDFTNSSTDYTITVPGNVEEVSINATKEDEKATIETTLPHTMKLPVFGVNKFQIKVKAEDQKATRTYTINIVRSTKEDTSLQTLEIESNNIDPIVSPYDYSDVPYDKTSLNIKAITTDNKSNNISENAIISSVTVNGKNVSITSNSEVTADIPLTTGDNEIVITVAAQDRSKTNTYVINVNRAKNDSTEVTSVEVYYENAYHQATYETSTKTYKITVPYEIDNIHSNTISTNGHVKITPESGAASYDTLATTTMTSKNLVTDDPTNGNVNTHFFTVTAEDGTSENYNLEITRTKNNNAELARVNAYKDGETSTITYCVFDGASKNCTISVPEATNVVKLEGILKPNSNNATIEFTDGVDVTDEYTLGATSTKTITATVTAENGVDKNTYTIKIERTKSSNSYLGTIKSNANQENENDLVEIDGFSSIENSYEIKVPAKTTSIKFNIVAEDPKSKVSGADITTPDNDVTFTRDNLVYGDNNIEVTVTAENGDKRIYKIKVVREKSTERRLSMIYIDGNPIDDYMTGVTFDPDTKEYTLDIFDYDKYSVDITADKMETDETLTGEGTFTLETIHYNNKTDADPYINDVVLRATAHNGVDYYDYTIHLKRGLSSNTDITKVELKYKDDGATTETLHEATWNDAEGYYEIEVPNSVDEINSNNLVVTPENGHLSTDEVASITSNTTSLTTSNVNDHKFIVTAPDGTVKEYTIKVTRKKSSEARLNDLKVLDKENGTSLGTLDPTFQKDGENYTVTIPSGTTEIFVAYEKGEDNQTVTGAGKVILSDSLQTVNVNVEAEDGTTKTYTLTIKRMASTDNSLTSLTVIGSDSKDYSASITPAISASTTNYALTIPGNVDKITITAAGGASVTYVDPDAGTDSTYSIPVGTKTIEIKISSESGVEKSYYLEVTRSQNNDATLKNLSYTLIKEDNTQEPQIIDLTGLDTENESEFTFDLGAVTNDYARINIQATTNDTNATVSGDINMQIINVGDNTYEIVTTAADGNATKKYIIKLNREASSDATLKYFEAIDGTLSLVSDTTTEAKYDLTVSEIHNTFTCSDLTYITNHPNATVTCDPEITLTSNGTNTFKIRVTAEDRVTTKDYILNITKPLSSDNTLKNVVLSKGILKPSFKSTLNEYTIVLPVGTTSFDITGIKNSEGQTIIGNGTYNVADLENQEVTISVSAENPNISINNYIFHIVEAESSDASLSNLFVAGYQYTPVGTLFDPSTYTYDIGSIDRATKELTVYAIKNNADAKVEYIYDNLITECTDKESCQISLSDELGTKTITVRVTPADNNAENVKEYTINYTKVSSLNNNLMNIEANKGTFDNEFSPSIRSYILAVDYEVTDVDLTITAETEYTTIEVNGVTETGTGTFNINNLEAGVDKVVNITATSETGDQSIYAVIIRRASATANKDNTLASLSVTDKPFVGKNDTFKPEVSNYTIGQIPYNMTELTVNAIASSPTSTISYYVNGVKQSSNIVKIPKSATSTITVKVTAEDKSSKDYVITLSKNPSSDATLKDLSVKDYPLSPEFSGSEHVYTVTIPNDVTSIDVTALANNDYASINLNGKPYLSGSTTTFSDLPIGKSVKKYVVVSESGNTTQTYTLNIIREGLDEVITSVEFGHDISDGYIKTFAPLKTVLDLKNELDNDNEKLEVYSADDTTLLTDTDRVGTGAIVKLRINGNIVDSKVVIIRGDTDGDGDVNTFDSSDILNHFVGRKELTGAALVAGDVDSDDEVTTFDSSDILNHFVGRKELEYLTKKDS